MMQATTKTRLALFFIAACFFPHSNAANFVASGNQIDSKPLRNVCLVYYQAIVFCESGQPPSEYSGYEVELFRKTAEWVSNRGANTEWSAGNYTFTCMDWDTLMDDLLLPDGERTCDVGVAGISATSERMDAGYRFTLPTYESGRQILIYASDKVDMFLFLKPFEANVWLFTFATSVVVGIAVLFAEVPFRRIIRAPGPTFEKYMNLQWAATGMFLQAMQQFSAKSVGARFIILGYAFMVLILVNAYIAVLSSQLTVTSINMNIKGLTDLASKPVGIFEADVVPFKKLSLQFMRPLPWDSAEDEAEMLSLLRSGELTALILDKPFVQYQAASSCDLYVVGDTVLPVNLGFAFPPSTNLDYVKMFSQGLTVLQEQGVMSELHAEFIEPSGCPGKATDNLATAQITMKQIAEPGLWVFLGAACVAGWALNISGWIWNKIKACRGMDDDDKLPTSRVGSMRDNRNQVVPSTSNVGSMVGSRSMSILKANPDMTWLSVGDASTTEEAMELLEAHLRNMDKKLKNMALNMDQRFNMLQDHLSSDAHNTEHEYDDKSESGLEHPSFTSPKKNSKIEDGVVIARVKSNSGFSQRDRVVSFSARGSNQNSKPSQPANSSDSTATTGPAGLSVLPPEEPALPAALQPSPPPVPRTEPSDAVLSLD